MFKNSNTLASLMKIASVGTSNTSLNSVVVSAELQKDVEQLKAQSHSNEELLLREAALCYVYDQNSYSIAADGVLLSQNAHISHSAQNEATDSSEHVSTDSPKQSNGTEGALNVFSPLPEVSLDGITFFPENIEAHLMSCAKNPVCLMLSLKKCQEVLPNCSLSIPTSFALLDNYVLKPTYFAELAINIKQQCLIQLVRCMHPLLKLISVVPNEFIPKGMAKILSYFDGTSEQSLNREQAHNLPLTQEQWQLATEGKRYEMLLQLRDEHKYDECHDLLLSDWKKRPIAHREKLLDILIQSVDKSDIPLLENLFNIERGVELKFSLLKTLCAFEQSKITQEFSSIVAKSITFDDEMGFIIKEMELPEDYSFLQKVNLDYQERSYDNPLTIKCFTSLGLPFLERVLNTSLKCYQEMESKLKKFPASRLKYYTYSVLDNAIKASIVNKEYMREHKQDILSLLVANYDNISYRGEGLDIDVSDIQFLQSKDVFLRINILEFMLKTQCQSLSNQDASYVLHSYNHFFAPYSSRNKCLLQIASLAWLVDASFIEQVSNENAQLQTQIDVLTAKRDTLTDECSLLYAQHKDRRAVRNSLSKVEDELSKLQSIQEYQTDLIEYHSDKLRLLKLLDDQS